MKKPLVLLFLIIMFAIGYFSFKYYQKKAAEDFAQEEIVSDFEDEIPAKCQSGEWVEFPNQKTGAANDFVANAKLLLSKDGEFTNEDGSLVFMTDENYSLSFFAGREARVEGLSITENGKRKIYVNKIKCVGKEANADVQSQRQNLMNYISANINSLAIEKSYGGVWQVQTFYFVNDEDVYVEYESLGSLGGDSEYDARLWLIRVSKMDANVPVIETLGYIQEDEDDPDKNVVKIGQDLYKDNDNMTVYEFDDDKKIWLLQ